MSTSKMKVSLITLSFNCVESLSHTIASVNAQTYGNIEHVIKDGSSSDGSFELAKSRATRSPVVVSKDDMGIYDALNQALDLVTGDIVGLVHSGDVLGGDSTVEKVVNAFAAEEVDVVWGNLNITSAQNGRVIREWRSKPFTRNSLYFGWMPPHPTLFVRVNSKFGRLRYNDKFKISGDYEYILRLLSQHPTARHINEVLYNMEFGGVSTRSSTLYSKFKEDLQATKSLHGCIPIFMVLTKVLRKLVQLRLANLIRK